MSSKEVKAKHNKIKSKYKLNKNKIENDPNLSELDKLNKLAVLDRELIDTINEAKDVKSFDKSRHKYDGLSWQEAIDKCKEIENDVNLSIEEKIEEFDLIGFGRQNQFMGLSYILVPTGSFICEYRSYKAGYKTKITNNLLYTPTNDLLPKIYIVLNRQVFGF